MKLKKIIFLILLVQSAMLFAAASDSSTEPLVLQHPFYVGVISGYGNTDWSQLVSQDNSSANATPSSATGTGVIIGALVGYQLTEYIGFEAQYVHYPTSFINFEALPDSVYPGITHFDSTTNYYAIMPKVMAPFDDDRFEAFGVLGVALVTRSDVLANIHDYRPYFWYGDQ